jgi:predicted Kef-type K+ transport protein
VYSFAALTVFTVVCLVRSTYGRGFIATHDDEIASEAVGLNTTRYKIVAFVVGAFFAGRRRRPLRPLQADDHARRASTSRRASRSSSW